MKELAAAPDRPLHEDEGSLTLAPGWPPASPQPATENPYGNTRERLTNGTALAVKCQDSRSSKIGIRRQVRRNPHVTLLRTLIRSEDEATRRCVVLNRRAPYDVLSDLENQFPELFVNNPALELYNSFKI